jgi:hypothetical protein
MPAALEETMFGMPPRVQSPTNFDGWLASDEEGDGVYGYVEAKQRRVGGRNRGGDGNDDMVVDAGGEEEEEDVDAEGEDDDDIDAEGEEDDVDAEGESVESEEM